MEFKNQTYLPQRNKDIILAYSQELGDILGDNLQSIAVFGSALGKYFIEGKSNINILFILKRIDVPTLKKCLKAIEKGERKNRIAPLFFTPEHIETSLDVFPIEFMDMSDNHLVIYGADFFEDILIDKEDLRLQCEREIKSKLIHLRQGYAESLLKNNSLKFVLENSLRAIFPILRAALRLKNCTPAVDRVEIINSISEKFSLDKNTFMNILNLRELKKSPQQNELEEMLAKYLAQLQRLADIVDNMENGVC